MAAPWAEVSFAAPGTAAPDPPVVGGVCLPALSFTTTLRAAVAFWPSSVDRLYASEYSPAVPVSTVPLTTTFPVMSRFWPSSAV